MEEEGENQKFSLGMPYSWPVILFCLTIPIGWMFSKNNPDDVGFLGFVFVCGMLIGFLTLPVFLIEFVGNLLLQFRAKK